MPKSSLEQIRKLAGRYPEAERTFLLGDHEVFRVRKKVYLWLGDGEKGGTYVSVKLKTTQAAALMLPDVKPAEYGMAKWGWVSADFAPGKEPLGLIAQWIDESYRHTAPAKLVAQLSGASPAPARAAPKRKPARKR